MRFHIFVPFSLSRARARAHTHTHTHTHFTLFCNTLLLKKCFCKYVLIFILLLLQISRNAEKNKTKNGRPEGEVMMFVSTHQDPVL